MNSYRPSLKEEYIKILNAEDAEKAQRTAESFLIVVNCDKLNRKP